MLIYDGDCGFCLRAARWAQHRLKIRIQAWQQADLLTLGLTPSQCQQAVQWVQGGEPLAGGMAVAATLEHSPWPWPYLGATLRTPGMAPLIDASYGFVASRRRYLTKFLAFVDGIRSG